MLKDVLIFPSLTANGAQEAIRDAINKYQDEETEVNFELLIESSVRFADLPNQGPTSSVLYTLVITVSERED